MIPYTYLIALIYTLLLIIDQIIILFSAQTEINEKSPKIKTLLVFFLIFLWGIAFFSDSLNILVIFISFFVATITSLLYYISIKNDIKILQNNYKNTEAEIIGLTGTINAIVETLPDNVKRYHGYLDDGRDIITYSIDNMEKFDIFKVEKIENGYIWSLKVENN